MTKSSENKQFRKIIEQRRDCGRGEYLLHYSLLDSTMEEVLRLPANLLTTGTVVVADQQLNGRGYSKTEWHSKSPQDLLMSVVVLPSYDLLLKMAMLIPLVVVEALKSLGVQTKIKWPNDIFLSESKLGGVLIENHIREGKGVFSICGIGINFSEITAVSVKSIYHTTSLEDRKIQFGRFNLLDKILEFLWYFLEQIPPNEIFTRWNAELNCINRPVVLLDKLTGKIAFEGTVVGVDETGRIEVSDGQKSKQFVFNEVSLVNV